MENVFSKKRTTDILFWIVVGFIPLVLLMDPYGVFYSDWKNHIWLSNYFGHYFQTHADWPQRINTFEKVGMPLPLFYGFLFYPIMGTLSAFVMAGVTWILVVLFTQGAVILILRRFLQALSIDQRLKQILAIGILWAIYPLTNLYNRGAFTEYLAQQFLLLMILLIFILTTSISKSTRRLILCVLPLLLTLLIGTHPISAVYGTVQIFALTLTLFSLQRLKLSKGEWLTTAVGVGMTSICCLPWVYGVKTYSSQFQISQTMSLHYYSHSLDTWFARLTPFIPNLHAYEERLVLDGADSTPHLDPQVSLVFGLVFLLWLRRRSKFNKALTAGAFFFCAGAILLIISISEGMGQVLASFLGPMQFPYRLVTYVNACWLIALILFSLGGAAKLTLQTGVYRTLMTISFLALSFKISHAHSQLVFRHDRSLFQDQSSKIKVLTLSPDLYSPNDYTTPRLYRKWDASPDYQQKSTPWPFSTSEMTVETLPIDISQPTDLVTNIQAFPNNEIFLDGKLLASEIFIGPDQNLIIRLQPTKGVLELKFTESQIWRAGLKGARLLILLWMMLIGFLTLKTLSPRQLVI